MIKQSRNVVQGRMVPAIESPLENASIGDIGSLPTVGVSIGSENRWISCPAIIDTGADYCALDESLLLSHFREQSPASVSTLAVGFSTKRVKIYRLDLHIQGESDQEGIIFTEVPVVAASLSGAPLLLGRRGVLEWLRLEIDFPRGTISLSRTYPTISEYVALEAELPSFREAMQVMEEGKFEQGIMILSLDLERWCDRMLKSNKKLKNIASREPAQLLSFQRKLLLLCKYRDQIDLVEDAKLVSEYRNIAVHISEKRLDSRAKQKFLRAAERIVSESKG